MDKGRKHLHHFLHPSERAPLPIVWDSGIMRRDFAEGRMIPLLIIETSQRPDVKRLIEFHETFGKGEIVFKWIQLPNRYDYFSLLIEAIRPLECHFIVDFDIIKQGVLVESIFNARAAYIQAGTQGDTLQGTFGAPQMVVELEEVGARAAWDRVFRKAAIQNARAQGASRTEAKMQAEAKVTAARLFASTRFSQLI